GSDVPTPADTVRWPDRPDSARLQPRAIAGGALARRLEWIGRMKIQKLHPLEHHASFRALVAAASPVAELATRLAQRDLLRAYAMACCDLAHGFAAPPDSEPRRAAHHRAWISVRAIDRAITEAVHSRRATAETVKRAQRAIDRADILVGALLPN
ncbi:MAG TPA: hypothetical protein VGC42_02155, partial [Kofleriaceae bacterium]